MKLIRVIEGVYRDESGNVHVLRVHRGDEFRWVCQFKDGIGCRIERPFRTLADVRKFLKTV